MINDGTYRNFKVLMTADTVGGVWVYAITLAKALEEYGVEILLATMGAKLSEYQKHQLAAVSNVRCCESEYKLEWMDDPWDDVDRAGDWLRDIADQFEPDVIHFNNYCHAALKWPCPSLVVGHSCVYSWFRDVLKMFPPAGWQEYYARVSAGLHNADMITAPSMQMLNTMKSIYGTFADARPIYNSSDLVFNSSRRKERFALSAGRLWDDAKNISILEKASTNLNCEVYMAGSNCNPVNGSLVNSENLHHLGFLNREQMNHWLSKTAVYVLPAKYEPFGLSALEAGLAGCALVLGDIPSLREIWDDTAVFVNPDDERQIAAALNELIDNEKLREFYAQRAYIRAGLYSTERMAQEYMDLYSQLISSSAVPMTLAEREMH